MRLLQEALTWSGSDVRLAMFAVFSDPVSAEIAASDLAKIPHYMRTYDLEDDAGLLEGRHLREFDFVWKALPEHLEEIVSACLQQVMVAGSEVAWFGFEGSFDYAYLLDSAVADQVYAVGASGKVWIALEDEERRSKRWKTLLAELREGLVLAR